MDIETLATDYDLPHVGAGDRDKHSRAGWVQFLCPWCESGKYHLGYSLEDNFFHCWSCGWHRKWDTLGALLGAPWHEAKSIARGYPTEQDFSGMGQDAPERTKRPLEATLPPNWGPCMDQHLEWLSRRGFVRPRRIVKRWGLLGTPNAGFHRNRIVAPVWRDGRLVTWQSRAIQAGVSQPYIACHPSKEARPIRSTVYGEWRLTGESVLIVEGIVDAWKMSEANFPAVATYGSTVSDGQIQVLREFRKALVLFDGGENEAWNKALRLTHTLSALGVDAECIGLDDAIDPGDFSKNQLVELMDFLKEDFSK